MDSDEKHDDNGHEWEQERYKNRDCVHWKLVVLVEKSQTTLICERRCHQEQDDKEEEVRDCVADLAPRNGGQSGHNAISITMIRDDSTIIIIITIIIIVINMFVGMTIMELVKAILYQGCRGLFMMIRSRGVC